MMADSDDDVPQLPADTLAVLEQFHEEQRKKAEMEMDGCGEIDENWQLSQFWYTPETAELLCKEAVHAAGGGGRIACISSPTLIQYFHRMEEYKSGAIQLRLFEYDDRFARKYPDEFVFYDYMHPHSIPQELKASFDVVIADPPFLADKCLVRTAQSMRLLARSDAKIILCTGAIMEEMMAPAGQGLIWSDVLCCIVCNESEATLSVMDYPINAALLSIVDTCGEYLPHWNREEILIRAEQSLVSMAGYLRRAESERGGTVFSEVLSRTMQRKLVSLLCFQLVEEDGRSRALKTCRAMAERIMTELLLSQQNSSHLSTHLWTAVRARGCQFLGPAMQEDVLKLILLTLEKGALIARKTLVMYVVQILTDDYPQVSKTCVGHVVQLLYRASCFNVLKRDGESSLMQLKEEYRNYESLRREHDAQIVQMAVEGGLRISPDQWSALLYGDQGHRSHMQSIIDKLQSPQSYMQSLEELVSMAELGDILIGQMVPLLRMFDAIHPTHHGIYIYISDDKLLTSSSLIFTNIRNEQRIRDTQLNSSRRTTSVTCAAEKAQQLYKTRICKNILNNNIRSCLDRFTGDSAPITVPPPAAAPPIVPIVPVPVILQSPTHHMQPPPPAQVVVVPTGVPPPPMVVGTHPGAAQIWSAHPPPIIVPHASPPHQRATQFWIQQTSSPVYTVDGAVLNTGGDRSYCWPRTDVPVARGDQTPDAEQLIMKRNEIINRLAPLTLFDEDDPYEDGVGHVSYTVASSVLDDRGELHPMTLVVGPPTLELPPIPASFATAPLPPAPTEETMQVINYS
uniref:RING-type E3 ubiquitin transferase n=1 Tax=Heterorhabditis bacteriophora TaxID=37862 RepID=A0A1I7XQQ8_HETBA